MNDTPKRDVLDALRGLLKHRTEDLGCYEFVLEAWIESAADEIEQLRSERQWIPVTERLPERNERVLVADESGVNVGSYSPMLDDWWSLHGDRMAPGPALTHWMPLPAPPETDK